MSWRAPVRAWWSRLATREQQLVLLMAAVLVLALVWFVGIAPALRTLRSAPAQTESLDAQLQSMQSLAAQARSMQGRPPLSRDDASGFP